MWNQQSQQQHQQQRPSMIPGQFHDSSPAAAMLEHQFQQQLRFPPSNPYHNQPPRGHYANGNNGNNNIHNGGGGGSIPSLLDIRVQRPHRNARPRHPGELQPPGPPIFVPPSAHQMKMFPPPPPPQFIDTSVPPPRITLLQKPHRHPMQMNAMNMNGSRGYAPPPPRLYQPRPRNQLYQPPSFHNSQGSGAASDVIADSNNDTPASTEAVEVKEEPMLNVKILKRPSSTPSNLAAQGNGNGNGGAENGDGDVAKSASTKSLKQREEEYAQARLRILGSTGTENDEANGENLVVAAIANNSDTSDHAAKTDEEESNNRSSSDSKFEAL